MFKQTKKSVSRLILTTLCASIVLSTATPIKASWNWKQIAAATGVAGISVWAFNNWYKNKNSKKKPRSVYDQMLSAYSKVYSDFEKAVKTGPVYRYKTPHGDMWTTVNLDEKIHKKI